MFCVNGIHPCNGYAEGHACTGGVLLGIGIGRQLCIDCNQIWKHYDLEYKVLLTSISKATPLPYHTSSLPC